MKIMKILDEVFTMATRGKNINLFLIDGNPNGRIKCTLSNWTGIVYKIPQVMIEASKEIDALQQSGVYFLFGVNENGEDIVYVGQAGNRKNKKGLLGRIMEPHNQIDYWTNAVMLTTRDNSFGATEISYLENRFCNMAIAAKRSIVVNGNDPNPGNITEEKQSELEEYIDYAIIVLGALGYKIFDPLDSLQEDSVTYYCNRGGADAKGRLSSDGFVLEKGSRIASRVLKSCPGFVIKLREKNKDKIKKDVLTETLLFSSPSGAAAFVIGGSANGKVEWKTKDGRPLKEFVD